VVIQEEALPAIAPFLESAVVVSDLECAQGLIKRYPDYQFVTMQGDVILSPAIYAGGAKADDIPGLIAIQRERKEFAVQMEEADREAEALGNQVREIQEQLEISNHELGRLREVRESKKKDRLLVQMKIDKIQEDLTREEKQLGILSQERERLWNEREAVQARAQQFALQLQEHTVKLEEKDREIQTLEQQLNSGREEQQQLQQRVNDSRIEIAKLQERALSLSKEIETVQQRQEVVQGSIAENRMVVEQKKKEISETGLLCAEMETNRLELVRQRDQQSLTLEELGRQKEELSERLTACDRELQAARDDLGRIREERNNTEIDKTRVETQKDDLTARCREEMEMELETLSLPESEWNELADDLLKNKLEETEDKIDRLGSINMLALEEYTQMEERHRFLKAQYEDLKVSIDTLLETIQRIDATSLKRFQEALQGVQASFQDLFQRLFNGGKAEMVLIDPENPNESGVDIHVQPPGKRLQNMHLLSGGEKTLTGIAFLMALFQYHASPFCVMDEVDAALDEVNVQRFTSLIAEMKQKIQFLIVTHNKRTMEAADQLYGVTMAEPGVSSILSARFEEAEALIEN
jgi:chromosome segregation protein